MNDGNLLGAIEEAQELLDTAGEVCRSRWNMPPSAPTRMARRFAARRDIDTRGEKISAPLSPISRVFLQKPPRPVKRYSMPSTRRLIMLGPGDLYTSILPNLLVDGVAEAIQRLRRRRSTSAT